MIADNINTTWRSGACITYRNDKNVWRIPDLKLRTKYHFRVFVIIVKVISYWIIKSLWVGNV